MSGALRLLAALTLGVALLAQLAHAFRVDIATRIPVTRPWLEAACAATGCEVGLPAEADHLTIESSDLNPDPLDSARLILAATLRNRAAYAQRWPHLELTLTDSNDRALARRVITPAEYLLQLPQANEPSGLAASSEAQLSLRLASRHNDASGYRLYLFHP